MARHVGHGAVYLLGYPFVNIYIFLSRYYNYFSCSTTHCEYPLTLDPSAISSPTGPHYPRQKRQSDIWAGQCTNAQPTTSSKNNIALDRLPARWRCCLSHRLLRLRGQRLLDLMTRPCCQSRLTSLFHSISLSARLWTFSLCFSSGQNWSDYASNSDRSSSDVGHRTKELLEDPFLLLVGVEAATLD
jgi:hypothetical protein